jgi:hypothetical protein
MTFRDRYRRCRSDGLPPPLAFIAALDPLYCFLAGCLLSSLYILLFIPFGDR